jgi:hypothetical protein
MMANFGATEIQNDKPFFSNRMCLAEGPIELNWHHCSVTSDFIGEFYALRCRATDMDYNEARHSIGYLVNELLENVVKFRAPGDIVIESSLDGHCFEIKITNLIDEATSDRFQPLLAELTSRDPGELLIERIEANAENALSNGSGLGLLTLMNDYGARLGWRFNPASEGKSVQLETFAALDLI